MIGNDEDIVVSSSSVLFSMSYPQSLDQDEAFDFLFKIVLIGDAGVGKTCVVQRFKCGTYVERHGSTIGVDFTMKTLIIDGYKVKVFSPNQVQFYEI